MEKKVVLLIALVFVVGLVVGLLLDRFVFTGEVVSVGRDYSYTTAICGADNECVDVLVDCSHGGVVGLEPVSDLIDFGEDWEDFRDSSAEFCL